MEDLLLQILESKNLSPDEIRRGANETVTYWCGTGGKTYLFSGNYLWLQFSSDSSYTSIGFEIEYTIGKFC